MVRKRTGTMADRPSTMPQLRLAGLENDFEGAPGGVIMHHDLLG
jgi:hypothetical protein